jgi:hypothetical protein
VIAIVGFCVVRGQPAVNAPDATCYPTTLRATAIGWCLGKGRIDRRRVREGNRGERRENAPFPSLHHRILPTTTGSPFLITPM